MIEIKGEMILRTGEQVEFRGSPDFQRWALAQWNREIAAARGEGKREVIQNLVASIEKLANGI